MSFSMPDFNALVSDYERLVEPVTAPFARRALSLSGVTAGDRLIDGATGTGALAIAAAALGARVLATDIAPAMVARVAERLTPFRESEARVMGCEALDTPDGSFDASFSMFGVTLFASWREGVAELARVTRPAGRIALATWTEPEVAAPMVILKRVFDELFPGREFWPEGASRVWSTRLLMDALRHVGSTDVFVQVCKTDWIWHSAKGLIEEADPLFRLVPGFQALTDAERGQIQGPLQKAFETYAQSDECIHVPVQCLVAVGQAAM